MKNLHRHKLDALAEKFLKNYSDSDNVKPVLLHISENHTYKIIDNVTKKPLGVMRITRPGYHTLEEYEAELSWLLEIKKTTDVEVANPLPAVDGTYIQTCEKWEDGQAYACMMFEFLPGKMPGEDVSREEMLKQYYRIGILAAKLHKQVLSWPEAGKLSRFSWDYEATIGTFARWGFWGDIKSLSSKDRDILYKTCDKIKQKLEQYGKGKERYGLIHSDIRAANLIAEGADLKVIDFDDCGFGWFLYDLAASVSFIEHLPITEELVVQWLAGYETERSLTEEDKRMIPTFIMQRRIQLTAWLNSHYESDPTEEYEFGYCEKTIEMAKEYLKDNTILNIL